MTALLLVACTPAAKQKPTAAPGSLEPMKWRISSYSETVPYTSVTAFDGKLYAGTPAGLIRFDEQTGDVVRITSREGLPGNQVDAVSDHPRSGLWVATNGGLARFRDGAWTNYPLAGHHGDRVTAMVATRWGVWAGGPRGLGQFKDGKWTGYLPGARINCLLPDNRGDGVWVGTAGEGIHHWDGKGRFVNSAASQGQPLRHVKGITYTQNAGVMAAGRGEGGHGLAFFDGSHWTAYRPRPAGRLGWVHLAGHHLLLSYADRILRLQEVTDPGAQLAAGPVELGRELAPDVPPGYPAPRFYTEPIEHWLPPDATVVVGQASSVLIGTRTAGLVRFDGRFVRWFRTNDLTGAVDKLRVACNPGGRCYLAGEGKAYRFTGDGFAAVTGLQGRVETFFNGADGAVRAVVVSEDGGKLQLARLAGEKWVTEREHDIAVPSGRVQVHFVRRGTDGSLWVGLGYAPRGGDRQPWGVAVLRADGSMLHHRSTLLPDEDRPAGSLALPDDIRDVHFLGDGIWLATGTGVCKVKGDRVQLFTENEGMASEIVHAVTRTAEGTVLAATHGGLGRFDGKQWRFDFDGALGTPTWALLREGGSIWVGTSRGMVRIGASGKVERSITVRDGLADERVKDFYRDPSGRLWVLTASGLSIVSFGA